MTAKLAVHSYVSATSAARRWRRPRSGGKRKAGIDAEIDSAGTGHWHIGEAPDRRARAVALRHGAESAPTGRGKCAWTISVVSATSWRSISEILAALHALKPKDGTAAISLLLDHVQGREGEAVADPYYGGEEGFEVTWADVTLGAQALARLLAELK